MTIPDFLSAREKEVAALLMQGKSNKQMAQALGVAIRTVEFHASHIYEKLGVVSRAEAVIKLNEMTAPSAQFTVQDLAQPDQTPDLRESAGGNLGQPTDGLRVSTVERRRNSSENGGNLGIPFRRISMRTLLFLIGFLFLACVGLAVLGVFFYYPTYRVSQGSPVPETGMIVKSATPTPWQPTPTTWQATPTVWQPTHTAVQSMPSAVVRQQLASGVVSYEGIRFTLDPAIASGATGLVMLAHPAGEDSAWWQVHPQYVRLDLQSYPVLGASQQPVVAAYPVEEYRRQSPQAAAILDNLLSYLAQPSASDPRQMPLLPLMNGGQVFHANVQRLDFQSGHGVRFLTLYAQYPAPVNNQDLFYSFQGLTSDGRYAVSVILPVSHPSLPASADTLSPAEAQIPAQNSDYYPGMAKRLSAESDASFTPDLSRLDALVQSLKVDR